MEYFVTGATGFIGTNLIQQLVADGHEVTALTRSRSNADHLPDGVSVVEGDVRDEESMREPMTGVDGLFHLAAWWDIGPGPRNRERAERINVDGTRNVLELMDELAIPKGVYTSSVGVYGNTGGEVVDESYRPDDPGLTVYHHTKWRAHYEVARPLMDEGLPLVIVLPGDVYGPGHNESVPGRELIVQWLKGEVPVVPRRFALPRVHVGDVAHGHLLAMQEGTPGEEYIISNESRRQIELFELGEELTGVPAPRTVSSRWLKLFAKLMTPVEWVTTPPEGFEPESFRAAGLDIYVDNSKAKQELGIEYRPFEESFREYLEWEMEQLGRENVATS